MHPWVGDSLTPYWLIAVGVTLGLVVLLMLWGLATILSKIPSIGTLAERPGPRTVAALILALAIFGVSAPLLWTAISNSEAGGKDPATKYESLGLWLGLLAAGSVIGGFAAVMLAGRQAAKEVRLAIDEGVLKPMFVICVGMVVFSIVGFSAVKEPGEMLASLPRLPYTGVVTKEYELPLLPAADNEETPSQPIAVSLRGDEVQRMTFDSSEPLEISAVPFESESKPTPIKTLANEQRVWTKSGHAADPLPKGTLSEFHVRNLGTDDAKLTLTTLTAPPYPEIATVPVTAAVVCAIFLIYMLQRALMPKLSAVALATAKSEVAQPMFLLLALGGAMLLILFVFLPYNTFGEDIKMLKESGIVLITVLCMILAVWAASNSVSEEIEGRTALTVLSKPIGRREFILGKYVGIMWAVFLLSLILGLVFVGTVGYKPIYDARESSADNAAWQQCHAEIVRVVPGLVLGIMEVSVLAALSVAISTRLPMLANFLICFAIYALGHLTPLIVVSSVGRFEIVSFFGNLIATVFPVLEHFNIQAAVAGGAEVPYEYLGWSLLYCLLYGALALLLALVTFEDRDLA